MATGKEVRVAVPEIQAVLDRPLPKGDFAALRRGEEVLLYDFASGRLAPLEWRHSLLHPLLCYRFHSLSDLLVAVSGGSFCSIFSRQSGRRLWSREMADVRYAAFCGPSLVVFTASGVLKVDWSTDARDH
jgi:hypothetical protein